MFSDNSVSFYFSDYANAITPELSPPLTKLFPSKSITRMDLLIYNNYPIASAV